MSSLVTSISNRIREWVCLKYMSYLWFYCCVFLSIASCAGRQSVGPANPQKPSVGLYRITERSCEYSDPGVMEECSRTDYVELVKGTFYGIGENDTALVFWQRGAEPTYSASDLGGRFGKNDEYVIQDIPPSKKEWLVVKEGIVKEYNFFWIRKTVSKQEKDRTRFVLKRVVRTPELNKLLAYPPLIED